MSAVKIVALIATLSLAFFAFQAHQPVAVPKSSLVSLWAQWKVQYGVSYTSSQEDDYRFAIFSENYAKIVAHNAAGYNFTLGINKFADLTGEEWKATYASCAGGVGLKGPGNDEYCPSAENCPALSTKNNEESYNWTAKGAVTGVKNQEQCGSCWAFSTTGSLEGLYFLNNGKLLSFSEQQLVDCATQCEACNGCWPYLAMLYSATYGNEEEKDYPYHAIQQTCNYTASEAIKVNTGYQCIAQKNLTQTIAGLSQQPVSIAVEANQASWQFYTGGVVDLLCGAALDHAVLLTGLGTWKNKDAFYVKNSWGADWGDNGYIWISTDDTANDGYGVCGILRCGTLPTTLNA